MKVRKLTTIALLSAVYVVLSILTPIRIINFKFTFEAFPVLVAALLMGSWDGALVGALGAFIYQLFFSGYGLTPTTPLWILPHFASGLLVGLYARKNNYDLDFKKIAFISVVSAFCVTAFNILALYVDSKMYGYYSPALVFGNIFFKIIVGIILAFLYASILPRLISFLKRKIAQ